MKQPAGVSMTAELCWAVFFLQNLSQSMNVVVFFVEDVQQA